MENTQTGIIYATAEGKKAFEKRLENLIARRSEIAEKVRVAREFGDLKENAEWAAAREEQSNLEDEIASIKERLPHVKVFSYAKADTSCVNIGTRVRMETEKKHVEEWTITGILENAPDKFYISNEAPLGRALLGKKVGDIIEIKKPTAKIKYKITKISAGQ